MISFRPGEDLESFQEALRDFAAAELRPNLRLSEEKGEVDSSLSAAWLALAVNGASYPEGLGGLGMDLRAAAVLNEEVAYGDIGLAYALPGIDAAGWAIKLLGTEEQQKCLIPGHLDSRTSLALLEPLPGFELTDTFTFAEEVEGGYKLWGRKAFVLNAGIADLTVVIATLDPEQSLGGLRAFVIEGRPPGISGGEREKLLGLETALFADLVLEGVFVPAENVLEGGDDFTTALYNLIDHLRVITAARVVGACRAALDHAAKYSTQRVAFGKPLHEHQAMAFMLAEMATSVDQLRWQVWRAAWALDTQLPEAHTYAATALHLAGEISDRVTSQAVQVLGGHGFIQDHPVEKWMRDTRTAVIVSGLDGFLLQEMADTVIHG